MKQEPGRFSTDAGHLSDRKISTVERGATWLLSQAGLIGPHTEAWAVHMVATRGIQALRTLQGLLALTQRHPSPEIEKACEIAHSYGAYRLAHVRRLIRHHAPKQEPLEFTQEHPMIRHISVYGDLVRTAIEHQQTTRRKLP